MGFWRRARDSIRATAVAWSLAVTTVHRTVALYRSSFESLLNFCKQKRTDTTRVSVPFSWRRARDSNPRTGYSPLHDFQLLFKTLKFVDIYRVSLAHIFVATAEIAILTYLFRVFISPLSSSFRRRSSSAIVKISTSLNSQDRHNDIYSNIYPRRDVGGKKAKKNAQF